MRRPLLYVERLGDDADRKDTHLASGCGDDWGSACAGAAAAANDSAAGYK